MTSSTQRLDPNLAISESGFLFLTSTGETFTANECARIILNALRQGRTNREIVSELLKEFEADQRTVERDVEDFVAKLHSYRLLSEKGD